MFEAAALVEHFPYIGIFILLILGDIGLPFPEDATLLLSGFLVSHGVIKLIPAFCVVYISLLITDFSLYLIGKRYGRKVVEHRRFRRILSPESLSKLEEKFERWSIWVVFFGRHLVGVRAQVFLTAGVMRMPMAKFLTADGASAIITIALWGGIGYAGGNSVQILRKDITRIEHLSFAILVILLAMGIFFWYFKSRRRTKDK